MRYNYAGYAGVPYPGAAPMIDLPETIDKIATLVRLARVAADQLPPEHVEAKRIVRNMGQWVAKEGNYPFYGNLRGLYAEPWVPYRREIIVNAVHVIREHQYLDPTITRETIGEDPLRFVYDITGFAPYVISMEDSRYLDVVRAWGYKPYREGVGIRKSWSKQAIVRRAGHKCEACGRTGEQSPTRPSDLTIDHIVPSCQSGPNDPSNFMVLCHSCNKKKGAMPLAQWWVVLERGRGVGKTRGRAMVARMWERLSASGRLPVDAGIFWGMGRDLAT